MTKRSQIKEHLQTLDEIANIMTAMKNLSLIEINKITMFIATQERVIKIINNVGADFLDSYPIYAARMQVEQPTIYILIGSERGFCGSFNENIVQKVGFLENDSEKCIVVGRKLSDKVREYAQIIKIIDGPNAAEEIQSVIVNLIDFLLKSKIYPGQWAIIYNTENHNETHTTLLRPFEEFKIESSTHFPFPPVLNQSKENFLLEFSNHYLFSLLYFIFYQSFIAENYQRLHHLENAVGRLEKQKIALKRHLNLLRQEEITEEIQVIMLSAEAIIKELSSQIPLIQNAED